MRNAIVLIIICFSLSIPSLVFCETDSYPPHWSGNINFFLGAKFLDDADWEPVDKHVEGAIFFDFKHNKFPLSIAIDLLYSKDDTDIGITDLNYGTFGSDVESQTTEVNLGVRKIWENFEYVRPVIGGGLAIINAELEARAQGSSVSDENTGFGLWIETGIYFTPAFLSQQFNIGVDARWSKAQVDLFDVKGKAGGWHIGALFGYHW